jgi:threonine synthase
MDVGNPSNMERLRSLYPEIDQVRGQVTACSVTDAEIRTTIKRDAVELGQVWCPHTATAAHVYRQLQPQSGTHWVLVSTAHPAKFNDIVEPLIGHELPVPPALAALLSLPRQEISLEPTLAALRSELQKGR